MPLVPAVVDAVAPTPVVAEGGIADGRGLAAAPMPGSHGALTGTWFFATTEAPGPERAKQRIAAAHGNETVRTHVFDIVRGYDWPTAHTGRALRSRFVERWQGRRNELAAALDVEGTAYREAPRDGDFDTAMVWAGEAVDLIATVEGAVPSSGGSAQKPKSAWPSTRDFARARRGNDSAGGRV